MDFSPLGILKIAKVLMSSRYISGITYHPPTEKNFSNFKIKITPKVKPEKYEPLIIYPIGSVVNDIYCFPNEKFIREGLIDVGLLKKLADEYQSTIYFSDKHFIAFHPHNYELMILLVLEHGKGMNSTEYIELSTTRYFDIFAIQHEFEKIDLENINNFNKIWIFELSAHKTMTNLNYQFKIHTQTTILGELILYDDLFGLDLTFTVGLEHIFKLKHNDILVKLIYPDNKEERTRLREFIKKAIALPPT